jgi:hypothetical protein
MIPLDDENDEELDLEELEDCGGTPHVVCVDCGHSWVCNSVTEPCPQCGSTRFENGDVGETDEELDEDESYERENDV